MNLTELVTDERLAKYIDILSPVLPILQRMGKAAIDIFSFHFFKGGVKSLKIAYKLVTDEATITERIAISKAGGDEVLKKARQAYKDTVAIRDALLRALVGMAVGGLI